MRMNLYCTVIGQKNRDGIYRFRFEEKQGTLREAGKEDSFPAVALAVWERGRILYAVSQEQEGSRIRSYSIQPDGSLTRRAEKEYGFSGVSYVRASEDGRLLWIAAYGCGAVAAVSLQDGRPGGSGSLEGFSGRRHQSEETGIFPSSFYPGEGRGLVCAGSWNGSDP